MDVQVQVHQSAAIATCQNNNPVSCPDMDDPVKRPVSPEPDSRGALQSPENIITFIDESHNQKLSPNSIGMRNRKNKPPNLQISPQSERHVNKHNSDDSEQSPTSGDSKEDDDASSAGTPSNFVMLRTRVVSTMGAGLNSPIVKRASRLEEILEIPDVAAALVRDEGYDMLRRRSYDARSTSATGKSCSRRQQTPGRRPTNEHFVFDSSSGRSRDADSESVSESDTSSIQSSHDASPSPFMATNNDRPRMEQIRDVNAISDTYNRISDSTGPAVIFGSPIEKEAPTVSPSKAEKKPKKSSKNTEDDAEPGTPTTTRKSRALLSRLKFASMSRSGSGSSLEGWDSLGRALARVGVTPSAFLGLDLDSIDLNPKISPILKRRLPTQPWCGMEPPSTKEPGQKPTIRKKTVSFSRLPNESCVKNAGDCVTRMHEGHQFVKMRSNSRVYNRLYWLDEVSNCLRWEPSKKDSGKARIEIGSIREVRPGKTTELFLVSDISTHFPDECSFSIIHGDGKTLDLIANSADDANVWITGLRCLMSGQDMEGLKMRPDARDTWLSGMFDSADINGDGHLDEEESLELIKSLSDGVRELRIKQKLQEHLQMKDNDKSRLSRNEFVEIFKDVATRPEVYFLLARYASGDDQLSIDDLTLFLESEQGMTRVSKEQCLSLINEFEPSETMKSKPALGIDGFTKYLTSNQCAIFDPKHLQVCQDMSRPLSHYFIASSHNTYLMEDQVSGPSNINAYIRALLRCCRCVELDCWDGQDGEPVVSHGHTRTNTIPFRQVIEAIHESAFRNSSYPVIVCLENHCSKEQQIAMATDLKNILGDKIYTEIPADEATSLPSPEDLKDRFLIRARKLPPECAGDVGYVSEDDEGREINEKIPSPTLLSPADQRSHFTERVECKQSLTRELSDLVSICEHVTLSEDFVSHQRLFSCFHTSSIHEKTAARLVESSPEEFVAHNKKFLTRVYPSGIRIDSSNFNPQDYWNCGVQVASLNYQTPGLMMDINDGKFSMNGGCGYVLKPDIMRDPLAYYNSQMRDVIPGVAPRTLHLRVISGQNFPKPRGGGAKGQVIDPYVLIELFGVPGDCAEQRTRTAQNNSGGSPIFDEPFEFRLSLPSLALVRFVVLDDDFIGDEFIGQYTIPFECLQPGYRHLCLRSIFDEPLENATLFVHVAISDADVIAQGSAGNVTPNQNVTTSGRLAGKRGATQRKIRKTRTRKDSEFMQMLEVNHPSVDDLFREAVDHLHAASLLRESHKWSLSYFRESCGVASLSSVKQCVRALAQRCRSDASVMESAMSSRQKRKMSNPTEPDFADEEGTKAEMRRRAASTDSGYSRLRRQPSDTSQSSTESATTASIHATFARNDRKISLRLKGICANNESWRKTSSALDALVVDTLAVLDNANVLCNALSSIYEKAAKLYEDLPNVLANGNHVNPEGNDVGYVANGTPQGKKASKSSKKKRTLSLDLDRKKRQTSEENFRWNCSVIKGQRDLLMTSYNEVNGMLDDLWQAGVQFGLVDVRESTDEKTINGIDAPPSRSQNENGNNNKTIVTSEANYNGTKSTPFMRSMSQLTRPRAKSAPKLSKRSISNEAFPVTSL